MSLEFASHTAMVLLRGTLLPAGDTRLEWFLRSRLECKAESNRGRLGHHEKPRRHRHHSVDRDYERCSLAPIRAQSYRTQCETALRGRSKVPEQSYLWLPNFGR